MKIDTPSLSSLASTVSQTSVSMPAEWLDPNYQGRVTVQDLYQLVKDNIMSDQENPLGYAPYDSLMDEWEHIADHTVSLELLRFLSDDSEHGLSFRLTGIFLLITRTLCTNLQDLYKSVLRHTTIEVPSSSVPQTDTATEVHAQKTIFNY